jgi:hypothetical protein
LFLESRNRYKFAYVKIVVGMFTEIRRGQSTAACAG